MLKRTEAIILKTTPFSDADLIVTALTHNYGLIKTFAKSPRKIKSRFGSSLEPLTYSRIAFWGKEDAELPRMTQSDIIRTFQAIRERIGYFFNIAEIVELTLNLLPEREANKDIFRLFLSILDRVENSISGKDNKGVFDCILYKIRFLDLAGYGPKLDGCARCGKSGYNFYISHGSIVCGDCAKGLDAPMKLSPGVLKLYEALRMWDLSKVDRIRLSGMLLSELSGLLDTHILYTTARPLKSRKCQS